MSVTPFFGRLTGFIRGAPQPVRASGHLMVLDGLRAAAALEVMFGHTTWLLWQADSAAPVWVLLHKITAFIVRYGAQAVTVFFVLSGFLIHFRYARQFAAGNQVFDVPDYAARRAKRIYPPLIFAIILTALLDWLGARINPALYEGTLSETFNDAYLPLSHTLPNLLGNLILMQQILPGVTPFGTAGPLWSLAYEGIFYVLYPLIYIPLYHRVRAHWTFLILLILTSLMGPLAGVATLWRILNYYGLWVFGAWLADVYVQGCRFRHRGLILGLAGVLLIVAMLGYAPPTILYDWLWALVVGLVIVTVAE
jgi:peptidoglycan/LPS O-acetylase OafA/YrhL